MLGYHPRGFENAVDNLLPSWCHELGEVEAKTNNMLCRSQDIVAMT